MHYIFIFVVVFPDHGAVCVNEQIVFECTVTDAMSIAFTVNGISQPFSGSGQCNKPVLVGPFLVELVGVDNNNMDYNATATIESVAADHDGTVVSCSDGTDTIERTVSVFGTL